MKKLLIIVVVLFAIWGLLRLLAGILFSDRIENNKMHNLFYEGQSIYHGQNDAMKAVEYLEPASSWCKKRPNDRSPWWCGPAIMTTGQAYSSLGKYDKAINEFSSVIRLKLSLSYDAYYERGRVYLALRQGDQVAADMETYLNSGPGWFNESAAYAALYAYFGYRLEGNETKAKKILELTEANINKTTWPYPILEYFFNSITLEELLSKATQAGEAAKAECQTYLGLSLYINGDRDKAKNYFSQVYDSSFPEVKESYEYIIATAWLSYLQPQQSKEVQKGTFQKGTGE